MNEQAKQFFEQEPDPYWYYSPGLRVPRPVLSRNPRYVPAPWRWLAWASQFTCRALRPH